MKLDILAIGVHPDDIELSCAGTLLSQSALGRKIGILDLTQGELGTRGNAETRLKEAADAVRILGVEVRDNLHLADGFFTHDRASLEQIIIKIREYKPEIVLCNAVSDRHPDHGRAGKLAADACFYSGLRKIITKNGNVEQSSWRPKAVYHYIQDRLMKPDLVVDITEYFEKKMEAIRAYRSQFFDPVSTEPVTPISGKDFLAVVEAKARVFGREIGVTFGEGYVNSRVTGVKDLFDLI